MVWQFHLKTAIFKKMPKKTTYSQVVKDIKSAKEFCDLNKITPEMVIVVWNECQRKMKKRIFNWEHSKNKKNERGKKMKVYEFCLLEEMYEMTKKELNEADEE